MFFDENPHSAAPDTWVRPFWVPRAPVLGVGLRRLVITAVLAASLPAVLSTHTAGPAAAPLIEAQPAEVLGPPPLAGAETRTVRTHSIDPAAEAGAADATAEADPVAGWFDKRELKLGAAGDDKSAEHADAHALCGQAGVVRRDSLWI